MAASIPVLRDILGRLIGHNRLRTIKNKTISNVICDKHSKVAGCSELEGTELRLNQFQYRLGILPPTSGFHDASADSRTFEANKLVSNKI